MVTSPSQRARSAIPGVSPGWYLFRPAIYTRVFDDITKCKVVLHYVMDDLRRYARARVLARTKKIFFHFAKKYFSVIQCINFLRCISLLTGNKLAVSWISGCQPWSKVWKACVNTNCVENEPDGHGFLKINIIVILAMFGTWVSVINISVFKLHTVLALCFRFHSFLRSYFKCGIISSVVL
jgi:hypothetical protein